MILPIYVYGHPVLRKVAQDITPEYEGLQTFVQDMFETLLASDGLGLAAPQVGRSIRLFVIDGALVEEDDPSMKGFKKAFINPRILERTGDEWVYNEGCLSLPNIHENVLRPSVVKIAYDDEHFVHHEETYDGLKARVIQHEYDHLQGVLFIDHIPPLKRKLIAGKLNAISKGRVEARYKIRTSRSK